MDATNDFDDRTGPAATTGMMTPPRCPSGSRQSGMMPARPETLTGASSGSTASNRADGPDACSRPHDHRHAGAETLTGASSGNTASNRANGPDACSRPHDHRHADGIIPNHPGASSGSTASNCADGLDACSISVFIFAFACGALVTLATCSLVERLAVITSAGAAPGPPRRSRSRRSPRSSPTHRPTPSDSQLSLVPWPTSRAYRCTVRAPTASSTVCAGPSTSALAAWLRRCAGPSTRPTTSTLTVRSQIGSKKRPSTSRRTPSRAAAMERPSRKRRTSSSRRKPRPVGPGGLPSAVYQQHRLCLNKLFQQNSLRPLRRSRLLTLGPQDTWGLLFWRVNPLNPRGPRRRSGSNVAMVARPASRRATRP